MKKILMLALVGLFAAQVSAQCPQKRKCCKKENTEQCEKCQCKDGKTCPNKKDCKACPNNKDCKACPNKKDCKACPNNKDCKKDCKNCPNKKDCKKCPTQKCPKK